MDEQTLSVGLLMEAARSQQELAEGLLARLRAHVQGLDEVVRAEIRHTLVEELQVLGQDTQRAAEALRGLQRAASLRLVLLGALIALLAGLIPLVAVLWLVPSPQQIAQLAARRTELEASIARLERAGAGVDLRRCGNRFCVRVDRKAPVYGASGDYFVVRVD